MVVSYGGRGGGKAAEALRNVLQGVRMRVVEASPGLVLGESMTPAMKEGRLVEGQLEAWRADGVPEEVQKAFGELRKLMDDAAGE